MIFKGIYFHWVRMAFLFLLRSGRSTFALLAMVMVAVASLIFLSAFAEGINDAMIRNSVGLFSGHLFASALPDTLSFSALKVDGVTHVLKRIFVPGNIVSSKRRQSVTMIGVNGQAEQKATAFKRKIIRGNFLKNDTDQLLLSAKMARQLAVSVGEKITFTPYNTDHTLALTICGIYTTGLSRMDDDIALCPIQHLQAFSETYSAAVFLSNGIEPEDILTLYDQRFGLKGAFETWKTTLPDLLQLIQLNYISMGIVILLVMGVVAMGIAGTFIVFIFKSIREYGILKAMGVTAYEIALLIVIEVIMINLLAGVSGEILGAGMVLFFSKKGIDLSAWTSHNQYFVVSGEIYPRLTTFSLFVPPTIALCFGLLAAIWPAVLVARKRAVDVLRTL
jgi:ABC-type lipoprotein release transport system permease subunit